MHAASTPVKDERVETAIHHWAPRFVSSGVPLTDFEEVTAGISGWDDWCAAWSARAAVHESIGRKALADGYKLSAGEHLNRAAICYHFGKFMFVHDIPQMKAAHLKVIECRQLALPLLPYPGVRVEMPYQGMTLAGILRSTEPLYGRGPMGIKCLHDSELQPIGPEAAALGPKAAAHDKELATSTQQRNDGRSGRYRVVRNLADAKAQLKKPGAATAKLEGEIVKMEEVIKDWDAKLKVIEATVINLETSYPPQPALAMAAREAAKPEDVRIHIRGTIENLGDVVPRGLPQAIQVPGLAAIPSGESGRRQLADWLAHPANPLTARVAVNRVWLHLFGRGLVTTPDDFGLNGTRPSHPELLDHLAAQFVADGWSTKKLIRSLVLSRVYQLGSTVDAANQERDPDNVFLWRRRPRALEAEALHDAMLAVSGQLDPQPRPGSLVAELPLFTAHELFPFKPQLVETQMVHRHRAVYLPVVRGVLPEVLKLFDFAEPSSVLGTRDETVVPAQASFLLNSPWVLAHARQLAVAVLAGASADEAEPLDRLFRRALSRPPTPAERERFLAYLTRPEIPLAKTPTPATSEAVRLEKWTSLAQVVLASTEFRFSF